MAKNQPWKQEASNWHAVRREYNKLYPEQLDEFIMPTSLVGFGHENSVVGRVALIESYLDYMGIRKTESEARAALKDQGMCEAAIDWYVRNHTMKEQ